MNEIRASSGRIVVLGRRKENQARCVTFDILEWQKMYGEGTVQLLAQRYQDATPYPVAVTVKNGIVRWVIKEADVAVPGEGRAELQYHVGDTVAKSDTYRTLTMPALGEAGPVPPDPEKSWVETVLQAAREAEQSAQDAKDAVTQTITIGDNGNWFIDGEDTGVSASGPAGHTPERGKDYWTPEDRDEIVENFTKQAAPVSYNYQLLTETQKSQARANIGAATSEATRHDGEVVFPFLDKMTIQIQNVSRWGPLCTFCLQFVVNEPITAGYGFTLATMPFAPDTRVWINNGTQFYMDAGMKDVRVNNSTLGAGSNILTGFFFIRE